MKKKMKNSQDQLKNPVHPEKKLVTRRDFLSSGMMGFAASVAMPTLVDLVLFEKAARAGECPTGGAAPGMMPFLIFDCAGGASLSGNWVVRDAEGNNGQYLPSYSQLGLGDQSKFVADSRFGAPMAAKVDPFIDPNPIHFSPIFDTLIANLTPAAAAGLRMGIICHTSLSDSGTNALSAISLVTAAGSQGSRIKNGLGTRQSLSAGNSDAASLLAAYRPMGIQDINSLTAALSYGPAYFGLPVKVKEALANALVKLSASQSAKLTSMNLGEQFAALSQCGFLKNIEYTSDVAGIDGRLDPDVQRIYGVTAASSPTSEPVLSGTLVKNAVEGNSGPAVITIGGCDYHTGNSTAGNAKDAEIGMKIALALNLAAAKGKKVAFQIFTDGGIYSNAATRDWQGDDNDKSLSVFGVMDPAGAPAMVSTQIGRYTAGQGADRNHFLGTDPVRVAHTVFLNYLAACGQKSRYFDIAQTNPLPTNKIDSLLLFQG